MTRKKERDIKAATPELDEEKEKSQLKSKESSEENVKTSKKEDEQEKSVEIKQLSGEEPGKLEYYSKDHLIEKIKKLEGELKNQTEAAKKAKEEAESSKNKHMRLQAEFENAQKRWDKNRKNLRLQYTASVLKSLLPLYDSFKKALSDEKENMKILKGFFDQFMSILKSHRAEPMNVKENELFDYSTQEALTSIENADIPKNTILEVIQDGWKLENDVLRYAKVIISKEPKPPEPKAKDETEAESEPKMEDEADSETSDKQTNDDEDPPKSKNEENQAES